MTNSLTSKLTDTPSRFAFGDGCPQIMHDATNTLKLNSVSSLPTSFKTYQASNSPYLSLSQGETFCRIDMAGRLFRNEIDITDDDKAMAECFVDYLKKFQNVEVKRGS